MMLKILAAAALVATANGAVTSWNSANGMCGGIDEACTNIGTCSTTGVGPCPAGEKAPKWHITSEFVGLAFTAPGYLADPTNKMKQIKPATEAQQGTGSKNGFRQLELNKEGAGGKYTYTMAGGIFGGDNTAWGYAGIASYFNSGTTDIVTDSNEIYGFGKYNPTTRTAEGPFKVCITKLKADGKCGDKVTFKPGDYKFSIFGTLRGADWVAKTKSGENGFPAAQDHFGVRMQVASKGITFDKVTLNGNVDLADIGETDVTELTLTQTNGTVLTYKFPKNFNYGEYATLVEDSKTPGKMTTGTASSEVKIHVSKGANAQSLYIDYLFPRTAIGKTAEKYFVYDPTINAKADDGVVVPTAGAAAVATSAAVAAAATAVAFLAM